MKERKIKPHVIVLIASGALLVAAIAIVLVFMIFGGERGVRIRRDISGDSPYSNTVLYANDSANTVDVVYTDGQRHGIRLQNRVSVFESDLTTAGNMGISYFSSAEGKKYFTDSLDLYVIDSDGVEWTDRGSISAGRVNSTRLGYYYYETKVQEYSFGISDPEAAMKKEPVRLADFTENWETNMVEVSQKAGKSMTINIEFPTDAYVLKEGLSVPADSATTIRITMSVTGSTNTAFFLFTDSTTRRFNDKQKKTFSVSNDGKSHTYYIDISDAIAGNLESFRLQFQGEKGDVAVVTDISALCLGSAPALKANKIYHIFPDKLHEELRICGAEIVDDLTEYGLVLRLPERYVDKFEICDAAGAHSDLNFDPDTVQYAGFHIKNTGVIGLIIPEGAGRLKVEQQDGYYVIRQIYTGSLKVMKNGWLTLYNRLYNDTTDSFEGIAHASYEERNPLSAIELYANEASGCHFTGYDRIRGVYKFEKTGSDFSTAYYLAPNAYINSGVRITNDTDTERTVYLCFSTISGALEGAALADADGQYLLPIPIEVCKNFCGEYEDRFYDPSDTSYGESYFPLVLGSGETTAFREYHLYQNWGRFPLKQLSSIQFHVSYYHLSTGVSESNCIAPYFVYGKDGWILPDFRGCSSKMWDSQPQFNSTGVTKLLSHYGTDGTFYQSEYTGSTINASGPTYADVEYSYVADDGSYEYTVRHIELPQTDESRTYYTLDLEFKKRLTIEEVRRDFTILMFNSRFTAYHWLTYTNENGEVVSMDMKLGGSAYNNIYAVMQKGSFWYTWNNITEPSHDNPLNYGVVVRDYDIKIGGKKFNGNFVVKNCCDGTYNSGYLSLDLGLTTFRKGDHIRMSFVLVPWGNLDWESHSNMDLLYEDCVLSPQTVTAELGTPADEKWLPRLTCVDNEAIFTVTGGRGNMVVRVDGFTSPLKPSIFIRNGDNWEEYSNAAVNAVDGYAIHFNDDGTYGFSFVYKQEAPGDQLTFRVVGATPQN